MKKIALVLGVTFFSVVSLGALASTSASNDVIVERLMQDKERTQVEVSELPQEITQGLSQSEYQAWTIQEAYKVEDPSTNETHYELHVSDGQMTETVKFSETGEIKEDQGQEGLGQDQGFDQEGQNQDQPMEDPLSEPQDQPEDEGQF